MYIIISAKYELGVVDGFFFKSKGLVPFSYLKACNVFFQEVNLKCKWKNVNFFANNICICVKTITN